MERNPFKFLPPEKCLPLGQYEELTLTTIVEGAPYPDHWTERDIKDYQQKLRDAGIEPLSD